MEEGNETTRKDENFEGAPTASLQATTETLPSPEFVKVEKNLASLGFFTPSSNRLRNAQEKSFTITTTENGQRIELKGTIIPSAKYGLPITADQDKWIALCKILSDILRKEGKVTNPISFSSADILRLLRKHRHSGKNYREIEEWLDVLFSTTIFSEGVVYLANEKRRVKDRFRVFDRVVSFGKELPGGKVADKNYAWLSDWQLQNINSNHLLPIDLDAYRDLKNHIAKALVPLLQIWLYATRKDGVFEKKYGELCEFLNIQKYQYRSLILRTLGPSLDELKQFGYLSDWRLDRTSDDEAYKIVFYHGEKFHRDRRARLKGGQSNQTIEDPTQTREAAAQVSSERTDMPKKISASPPVPYSPATTFDPQLVAEFTGRGIAEDVARDLIVRGQPGQDFVAQLEMADADIKASTIPIRNPAGYRISYVRRNIGIPDGFETIAKRKIREARESEERTRRAVKERRAELEDEYDRHCSDKVDLYITEHSAEFDALKQAKAEEERIRYGDSWIGAHAMTASWGARLEIRKRLPLPTFEEFLAWKREGTDSSLQRVTPEPPEETPEDDPVARSGDAASVEQAAPMIDAPLVVASEVEAVVATPAEAIAQPTPDEPMMLVLNEPPTDVSGSGAELV